MPHLDCPCFVFLCCPFNHRTVLPAASTDYVFGWCCGLVSRPINFFISFSRALTSDCKNRCLRCCSIRRSPMALFRQSVFANVGLDQAISLAHLGEAPPQVQQQRGSESALASFDDRRYTSFAARV